ncbi:MAG: hypothetical protein M0Z87_10755 [Actinomycetota bacterium]|nr:hypothetical protein [Actinomycetota bacterium]
MAGQIVDTPVARDFVSEVLARVAPEELASIADSAQAKSDAVRSLLTDGAARLGRPDLRRLLRSSFVTRRRADAILDSVGHQELGAAIDALLQGWGDLHERLSPLTDILHAFPEAAADLPFELLRFGEPERWWPWTRWMWDPRSDTGALRLLIVDEVDLFGATREDTYHRVGEAMAVVEGTARAAGLGAITGGQFGVDVFLGCVYGVYMYTVLRLRMSQEFNRIVPELPELVRRLLGVHNPEVRSCQ